MNTFDNSLFEDIKTVRERGEDMEEALERLTASIHFTRISIIHSMRWERLCEYVDQNQLNLLMSGKEYWAELIMPELFLAICEVPEAEWDAMWYADMNRQPEKREHSVVYLYLRNIVSGGLQRALLDGATTKQYDGRGDESWPTENGDPTEPDLDAFEDPNCLEDTALNKILAAQIRETLTDDEYDILMAGYGDDPELAERLGVSEGTIRMRRFHLRRRLQNEFEIS